MIPKVYDISNGKPLTQVIVYNGKIQRYNWLEFVVQAYVDKAVILVSPHKSSSLSYVPSEIRNELSDMIAVLFGSDTKPIYAEHMTEN